MSPRPPKDPEDRKASMFSVRLTAAERGLIDAAASPAKASAWARKVLLAAAKRKRKTRGK